MKRFACLLACLFVFVVLFGGFFCFPFCFCLFSCILACSSLALVFLIFIGVTVRGGKNMERPGGEQNWGAWCGIPKDPIKKLCQLKKVGQIIMAKIIQGKKVDSL